MNDSSVPLPEAIPAGYAEQIIGQLDFSHEMGRLRAFLSEWKAEANEEMAAAVGWQFGEGSKYFRPLTVFSTYRAVSVDPVPERIIHSAFVIELFHNVSLVIDDILDGSDFRRGKHTLHKEFGMLQALMTSGWITADGFEQMAEDPQGIRLFAELMKRLGAAECMQWRLRQRPLGVEDWRRIAGEDTGTMFEICACLGDRSERLRQFGHLLGVLYHGCDDVADIRGTEALGGGGNEDIRDGILTLPAAIGIRDPAIADLFCHHSESGGEQIAAAFRAALPEAERYLDQIAEEAREEARLFSDDPEPLYAIVAQTRKLSS